MKLEERNKAIELRKKGYSYSEILKKINVSKSTISSWLRDIELTIKQKNKLLREGELGRYKGSRTQYKKRIIKTKEIIEKSKNEFNFLIKNPLFLSGLMLYWAEGDKHKQERVKFTNSDEAMICLMMRWFREICKVPESKFRIALHVHNLHFRNNVKRYWAKLTNVPQKQFQKTYIKKSSLRYRRNILYNGTCAIVVNDKNLFRRILGWRRGLLEYFGLSLPVVQRIEQGTSNPQIEVRFLSGRKLRHL